MQARFIFMQEVTALYTMGIALCLLRIPKSPNLNA